MLPKEQRAIVKALAICAFYRRKTETSQAAVTSLAPMCAMAAALLNLPPLQPSVHAPDVCVSEMEVGE